MVDGPGPPLSFHYYRSLAPILWVFVALGTIELVVVHALLSFWSMWAAAILSALSLATLVWLVLAIRSFRRMPVIVDPRGVTMRAGLVRTLFVPIDAIAGVRLDTRAEDRNHLEAADFALVEHPNVTLDLAEPLGLNRRAVWRVSHKLDEPGAFAAAVEALLDGRKPH